MSWYSSSNGIIILKKPFVCQVEGKNNDTNTEIYFCNNRIEYLCVMPEKPYKSIKNF